MSDYLKNFDLTVEEIKTVKTIEELIVGLEKLQVNDQSSARVEFFRGEIDKLKFKLEQIRENTLIR